MNRGKCNWNCCNNNNSWGCNEQNNKWEEKEQKHDKFNCFCCECEKKQEEKKHCGCEQNYFGGKNFGGNMNSGYGCNNYGYGYDKKGYGYDNFYSQGY